MFLLILLKRKSTCFFGRHVLSNHNNCEKVVYLNWSIIVKITKSRWYMRLISKKTFTTHGSMRYKFYLNPWIITYIPCSIISLSPNRSLQIITFSSKICDCNGCRKWKSIWSFKTKYFLTWLYIFYKRDLKICDNIPVICYGIKHIPKEWDMHKISWHYIGKANDKI